MTETTDNTHHTAFGDKGKITRFLRKHGPNFFLGMSIFFLGMSILWWIGNSPNEVIVCLLLAGLMLGYAVAFPFLAKHVASKSRDQNS